MLSASAFNALLKIMEEPPEYVKFILATTEIHKVPATVASRCQRYDFRRIRQKDIAQRLLYIAGQENISLSDDGAALIAKIADGGMRDAVSLLDQCSVSAENITAEVVSRTAGIAGRDSLFDILEAVVRSDAPKAVEISSALYDMSKDLSRLCEELILQMRNIMLIKAVPATADNIITAMPDELERLKAIADSLETEAIIDKLSQLQDCRERMNRVMNKRVEFEMSLIAMCSNIPKQTANAPSADVSELTEKIALLEKKLRSVSAAPSPQQQREIATASSPAAENIPPPNVKVDIKNVKEDELTPCTRWNEIMEEFRRINPAVAGSLEGSTAASKGNVMCIFTPNKFFISLFKSSKENAISLSRAIFNVLGQKYSLSARCTATVEETRSMAEQLVQKALKNNIDTGVQ